MGLGPVLGIAVLRHTEDHFRQSGERQIINIGCSIGQIHVFQTPAILEGVAADCGHPFGEINALQAAAVLKCGSTDHL